MDGLSGRLGAPHGGRRGCAPSRAGAVIQVGAAPLSDSLAGYCGPVFTQPDDLAEGSIGDVLLAGWGFMAMSVEYQAVGFGSHHWLASDARGARLFVTVDDLSAKRRTASDTTDAAFDRLTRAFSTALSLRADAGLAFVVAPVPVSGANEAGEPNGEPTTTDTRPCQATSSHGHDWWMPRRATSSHVQRPC
jgi:hypothetical protein